MLSLSEDFIREVEAGTSAPVLLVEIAGATPSKFLLARRAIFGHPCSVISVTGRQSGIDPLRCTQTLNTIVVDFQDDGDIRTVISTLKIIGKTVTISLGFDTGDDATFPEGSFAPYTAGVVDRWEAEPGIVRLVIRDVRSVMFERRGAAVVLPSVGSSGGDASGEPHPFRFAGAAVRAMRYMIEQCGISTDFYDPDSFLTANNPLTGHLTVDRRHDHSALREPTPVATLLDEIAKILRGYVLVQEDGVVSFVEFDASASAVDRFLESDIITDSVRCMQDMSQLVYGVTIRSAWSGAGGGSSYGFQLRVTDETGEGDWGFSDASDGQTDFTIDDQWFTPKAATKNGAVVASGATTINIVCAAPSGGQDSPFYTDGLEPAAVDSGNLGYMHIRGITLSGDDPNPGEILEYQAIAKAGTAASLDYQLTSVTRGVFNTDDIDHDASLGSGGLGPSMHDVSAIVRCAQEVIKRFREGAMVIEFKTPLHKYAVQLADVVYIETPVAVRYGLTSLASGNTTPFECVQKEVDYASGVISWKFVEIRASSHTSVIDRYGDSLYDLPAGVGGSGSWRQTVGSIGLDLFAGGVHSQTGNFRQSSLGAMENAFIEGTVPAVPGSGLDLTLPWQRLATRAGMVDSPQQEFTFAASKDTYVDVEPYPFGLTQWSLTEVANGASAPALTAGNHRAFKVVTDGSDITEIVDLRESKLVGAINVKDSAIGATQVDRDTTWAKGYLLRNADFGVMDPRDGFLSPGISGPPDGYSMSVGTWGTDVGIHNTEGETGPFALWFIDTAVATAMWSSMFPVEGGRLYKTAAKWKTPDATPSATFTCEIFWYTEEKSTAASTASNTVATKVASAVDTYEDEPSVFKAPADARFARLKVRKSATAEEIIVDRLTVELAPSSFHVHKNGTNQASVGTGETLITWSSARYNNGSDFDFTSEFYTVPRTGRYRFGWMVRFSSCADGTLVSTYLKRDPVGAGASAIMKNGTRPNASFTSDLFSTGTVEVELNAGDTIGLYAQTTGAARTVDGGVEGTYFWGEELEP